MDGWGGVETRRCPHPLADPLDASEPLGKGQRPKGNLHSVAAPTKRVAEVMGPKGRHSRVGEGGGSRDVPRKRARRVNPVGVCDVRGRFRR